MPWRERVGVVLERVSKLTRARRRRAPKTREEGEGYAPTITYFCASSKFSTSSKHRLASNFASTLESDPALERGDSEGLGPSQRLTDVYDPSALVKTSLESEPELAVRH